MNDNARGRLRWEHRLTAALAPLFIRLLYRTWRIRVLNDGAWRARRAKGMPYIFSLWHGQLLPLIVQHRGEGVGVLISEHRDGELIARIVERVGLRTIRGSSSRGAARALLGLSRALSSGQSVAVTPDGPRGPAHSFAPGALIAAQRSGMPIVPIGVHAARAWRLRSWDAFLIPKPFTRLVIAYGDPVFVTASDARGAAAEAPRFQALMDAVEMQAQTYGMVADVR